jgi:hypothetical protein
MEFMYESKLNQFLSSFHEIYRAYKHMDSESFFQEWFDRNIIRDLVYYFPPSAIVSSYEDLKKHRLNLLKTYIRVYWRYGSSKQRYPAKVEEALRFFGLKELDKEQIIKRYMSMVKKFHPDSCSVGKNTHIKMAQINYYYQVLRRYLDDGCYDSF